VVKTGDRREDYSLPAAGKENELRTEIHGEPVTFAGAINKVLGIYLITRVFLFLTGYLSNMVLMKGPFYPKEMNSLLDIFYNWDAGWYLTISQHGYGYVPGEYSSVAFFPLYPILVKILSLLIDEKIAGYLISNLALLFAVALLYKIIMMDNGNPDIAYKSALFLLISPVSIFFSIIYSESLFLLTTIGTFYYARKGQWLVAAGLGFLAALTRSLGVLLVVPFVMEYFGVNFGNFRVDISKLKKDFFLIALIPAGLVCFMVYLYFAFGDALAFSKVQVAWGRKFVIFTTTLKHLMYLPLYYRFFFLSSIVVGLGLLIYMIKARFRISYILYSALLMCIYLSTGSPESIPRFISVIFPMYISMAVLTSKCEILYNAMLIYSISFCTLSTVLFVNGYWFT